MTVSLPIGKCFKMEALETQCFQTQLVMMISEMGKHSLLSCMLN